MNSASQPAHTRPAYPQDTYFMSSLSQENEVSLYDLWKILVSRKRVILFFTLTFFSASFLYVWLAPPAFKAEVLFLPPDSGDLLPINKIYEHYGSQEISINSAYLLFKRNLGSKALQRAFFSQPAHYALLRNEFGSTQTDDELFIQFSHGNISIETRRNNSDFLALTFYWSDPNQAAELANAYVQHVIDFTVHQLVKEAKKLIASKRTDIENNIAAQYRMAAKQQEDQIIKLKEALTIVNAIDLIDMMEQFQADDKLYMRGRRLLNAELAALNSRESIDAFIPELRSLQEELEQIKAIQLEPTQIRVARLDQPAYSPSTPIKPKKNLILILGIILGILLGSIYSIFYKFSENNTSNKTT